MVLKLTGSLILLLSLSCTASVVACSCVGHEALSDAYARAKGVFIGFVREVDDHKVKAENGLELIGSQVAYVQVEKAFKGNLDAEIVLRSHGSSCDYTFKEGGKWLFYAGYDNKEKEWLVHVCSRSTGIENADDDLLFLQALPKSAESTRISGFVKHFEDDPEKGLSLVKSILGARVLVIGADKTYEIYTDKNGVYEIYGVPPGAYRVTLEIPPGLKIRNSYPNGPIAMDLSKKVLGVNVILKDKSSSGMNFMLSDDTRISGKLIGADGQKLANVCLRLEPAEKPERPSFFQSSCTDKDGSYHFEQVPGGDYFIIANREGKLSGQTPFPRVYYPGTIEKEKATRVTVSAGEILTDLNIHVPVQMPTRMISGVLETNDGKPFAQGSISFKLAPAKEGYVPQLQANSDEQGRFSLVVLRGQEGILTGSVFVYSGQFGNCSAVELLLKGKQMWIIETNPLSLTANSDISEIKLRFPFPHCEKAKN